MTERRYPQDLTNLVNTIYAVDALQHVGAPKLLIEAATNEADSLVELMGGSDEVARRLTDPDVIRTE